MATIQQDYREQLVEFESGVRQAVNQYLSQLSKDRINRRQLGGQATLLKYGREHKNNNRLTTIERTAPKARIL